MLLKSQRINTSFLDYLFASSFTTISDLATKGYSSLNDDKYKKIISECKITSYTDEPTEDVKEYYTRFAGKRTKREL